MHIRAHWRHGGRPIARRPTTRVWMVWPAPWRTGRNRDLVSAQVPRSGSRSLGPASLSRSVRFTTGAIRAEADRRHVVLPRIGRIRTHESTRKLARRLEAGTARILSATVSCRGGRWYCSFQVIVAGKTRPAHVPPIAASGSGRRCRGKDLLVVATPDGAAGGSYRSAETLSPGAIAVAGGPTPGGAPPRPLRSQNKCATGALKTLGARQCPGAADSRESGGDPRPRDPSSHHRSGYPPRGGGSRAAYRRRTWAGVVGGVSAALTVPSAMLRWAASVLNSTTRPTGTAPHW